jgi:cation:H+ antiporter
VLVDVALLVLGAGLLYFGAESLVKGAAGLARVMGMRPLAVGLTIVAYGTSAPELVVSVVSALEKKSALALGNVVGSNIANIGLILGVTALIAPPRVSPGLMRRELPIVMLTALGVPIVLIDGRISRIEGIVLLLVALFFTLISFKAVKQADDAPPSSLDEAPPPELRSKGKLSGYALVGLLVLLGGGKYFVMGATGLALALGMSERVVGLTVVAVGTSLPELAASLVAALRGHPEIALGNVLGSNVFNVTLILGASAVTRPIAASLREAALDLSTLGVLTVLGALFMRTKRRVQRWEGALLLAIYAAFVLALVFGARVS